MPAVYTIGTPYTTAEKRRDGAVQKYKTNELETIYDRPSREICKTYEMYMPFEMQNRKHY